MRKGESSPFLYTMEKFMKRTICILLVAITLLCGFSVVASAESTDTNCIYLQVPTAPGVAWNNFSTVFCHIWDNTGEAFYPWQSKDERCTDLGNGYYSFDLSNLEFNEEGEYAVIFSNDNGLQTYDLTFTSDCKGDIVYCNGDTCKNPVDSSKTCTVARWIENKDNVHPRVQEDSDGIMVDPDGVASSEISVKWGSAEGKSVELQEIKVDETTEDSKDIALISNDDNKDIKKAEKDEKNFENSETGKTFSTLSIVLMVCGALIIVVLIVAVVVVTKKKKNSKK